MAKKSEMTLEKLAQMVAQGFDEVKGEMATKADLADVKTEVRNLRTEMNNRFDAFDLHFSATLSLWRDELDDLKQRVSALEQSSRPRKA